MTPDVERRMRSLRVSEDLERLDYALHHRQEEEEPELVSSPMVKTHRVLNRLSGFMDRIFHSDEHQRRGLLDRS